MIFTKIFFSALAYVCLILVWLSLVLVAPKAGNKIWASWQEAFAAMTTYWRKRVWRISRTCACVCLELYVYPFKPIPLSLSTHPTVPIYLPFAMCWQWSVPIYFCSADWCLQLASGICLKALPSALKTWPGVHCSDSGLMTHGPLLMNSPTGLMHSTVDHWSTTFAVTFWPLTRYFAGPARSAPKSRPYHPILFRKRISYADDAGPFALIERL